MNAHKSLFRVPQKTAKQYAVLEESLKAVTEIRPEATSAHECFCNNYCKGGGHSGIPYDVRPSVS